MNKILFAGIVLGAAIAGGVFFIVTRIEHREAQNDGAYIGFVHDGEETPLRIPYNLGVYPPPRVLLSPDGQKIIYAFWENAGFSFYLTDLEGSSPELISRQHVGEGSGGINTESLFWSEDSQSISYNEMGLQCRDDVCDEPGDFSLVEYQYTVDIATKEEVKMEIAVDGLTL